MLRPRNHPHPSFSFKSLFQVGTLTGAGSLQKRREKRPHRTTSSCSARRSTLHRYSPERTHEIRESCLEFLASCNRFRSATAATWWERDTACTLRVERAYALVRVRLRVCVRVRVCVCVNTCARMCEWVGWSVGGGVRAGAILLAFDLFHDELAVTLDLEPADSCTSTSNQTSKRSFRDIV
eukprot:2894980-Rhodomonas_salina.1